MLAFATETTLEQEYERRQLASAIHNGPLQYVTHVLQTMYCLGRTMELTQEIELLRTTSDELRQICNGLYRPERIYGLETAVKQLVYQFRGLYPDIEVTLQLNISHNNLPERVEAALYHVTNEALNNIGKHAQATAVQVSLTVDKQQAALTVRDNGVGMGEVILSAPLLHAQGHFGLLSLWGWAEASAGQLTIADVLPQGTRLSLDIPLQNGAGGGA